jgi:glycosyltransferase involved in cell wall biosynthesis
LLSIIIPVNNEQSRLDKCLGSLLASDATPFPIEIVVVTSDATEEVARSFESRASARGWELQVININQFNRVSALNAGDATARWPWRAYLSDEATVSPQLLSKVCRALDGPKARYAYERASLNAATCQQVSTMAPSAHGCEFYAVNAAGRARWGQFPNVVSDDVYIKLLFSSKERTKLSPPNDDISIKGFQSLAQLRLQEKIILKQLRENYPELVNRYEERTVLGLEELFSIGVKDPFGLFRYFMVGFFAHFGYSRLIGR